MQLWIRRNGKIAWRTWILAHTYSIYKYINFLYKHIVLIFFIHSTHEQYHDSLLFYEINLFISRYELTTVVEIMMLYIHREMKNAFNDKIIWSKIKEARFISMICRIFLSWCFSTSWMYFYFVIESSASTYLKSFLFLVKNRIVLSQ